MDAVSLDVLQERDLSLMSSSELKREKEKSKEAIKNQVNKINRSTRRAPVLNPAFSNLIRMTIEKNSYLFPKPTFDHRSDSGKSIIQDRNIKNSLRQLQNKNILLETSVIPEKIKENNHLKKSISEAQK